jgi:hypothetical protein
MAGKTTYTPWSSSPVTYSTMGMPTETNNASSGPSDQRTTSGAGRNRMGCNDVWKYLYPLEGDTGTILPGIGSTIGKPILDQHDYPETMAGSMGSVGTPE